VDAAGSIWIFLASLQVAIKRLCVSHTGASLFVVAVIYGLIIIKEIRIKEHINLIFEIVILISVP
jgi:hypothetical protein